MGNNVGMDIDDRSFRMVLSKSHPIQQIIQQACESIQLTIKPISEIDFLKKLNMELIIKIKNLNETLSQKDLEIKQLKDKEWDLLNQKIA